MKWYQEHIAEMTSDNLAVAARARGISKTWWYFMGFCWYVSCCW